MILVTGAGGKTGQALVRQLTAQKIPVRAWVQRNEQIELLRELGASEIVVGDLQDNNLWQPALSQCDSLYLICPNMHPHETDIAQKAIAAAVAASTPRLVYHSVLHPQTQKMPHHWQKLLVEEMLFESGLDITILQPAAYMQNIWGSWQHILEEGVYRVPYPVTTRLSVVDLEDVAATAVTVLTQPHHTHATYELAGPQPLSPQEMATILSQQLNRPVVAQQISNQQWQTQAQAAGTKPTGVHLLLQMFDYYGRYQFQGNTNILRWLLGREPTNFQAFAAREYSLPPTSL